MQNHYSSLKPTNNGVPQRSIVGPLLFLTYAKDILNSVSCDLCLFADDTCLLVSSPSLTVLENECNKEISANKLQMNPEKSAIMVIPSKLTAQTTNLSIFNNERPINCFESSKYVGVNLDNKLNFKSHLCIIENKLTRSVGILSKLRYQFPSLHFFCYIILLFTPHLLVGLPLRGNANKSSLNGLQRLQNKAIRIHTNYN